MARRWVERFVEEERQRDAIGRRDGAMLTREVEVTQTHSRRLLDALRSQVARDVEAFSSEFPERAIAFEMGPLDGGFVVRRGHFPEVRLTVAPNAGVGTISVEYVLASGSGTSVPKPRELVVDGHQTDTLHFRDEEGQQAFREIEQLSEYLLVPVFVGRLRTSSERSPS